jgi:dTDP-4-amino-4,6-dideoxygalactose transaminase
LDVEEREPGRNGPNQGAICPFGGTAVAATQEAAAIPDGRGGVVGMHTGAKMGVIHTIPFVNLQRLHQMMGNSLDGAFFSVVKDASFTMGPKLETFEDNFAAYIGVRHAVGVGSGTDALHLALVACGVGPGSEVITVANTFAATAEAIVMAGGRPVFVDVAEDTLLMDLDAAEAAITERTRAIIPVHLYGQPVDMDRLMAIARPRGIKVIEDACQSHGARCGKFRAGGIGDAGCFSFYPSKNLGALGDGGMVTTDDDEIAHRVRLLRNHGEDSSRLHVESGHCTRLHALQAAFLNEKLPLLDEWNALRMRAAALYDDILAPADVVLPVRRDGATHVYHLYVVRVSDRDQVREELAGRGIQTGIHYAVPLHLEPAFAHLGYSAGDFPVCERAAASIVSLPMYPYIEFDEVSRVGEAVTEVTRA